MVLCDKNGKVIRVYPYSSEEQWRYERVLEILLEADKKRLDELLEKRRVKEAVIDSQIKAADKQVFGKQKQRSVKRYNLTQTAHILGVHRQTIYYWIKQGWVKPKRDFRGYPVFTVLDIEKLVEWRETIKC